MVETALAADATSRVREAVRLMDGFADRTGLTSSRAERRYLWTDAFAVCNFLGLARATGDGRHAERALRLVDRVHHTLGKHRPDDGRTGWLSGLPEQAGTAHPTRGGLRIGKPRPERRADEPVDERLEWDGDGQDFHYLTKWMHALDQVSGWTAQPRFNRWARELAHVAYRAFRVVPRAGGPPRLVWKMSIDLSRALVPSMGQHDPLDGFITCPWRRPIASLNYLLSSHVWRQDHNGFSHQDPGFIDHVVNKKAEVIRVYLPPDANCLLSVTDHCLRSRNYVNVIVAGKQPAPQWLTMDQAIKHCTAGIGIWDWASNDQGGEPDVVMACCGDVPTLETLAAVHLLRQHVPELRVRVINVVNLMKLQPREEHPHGLSSREFDVLFTTDKPIIFAFHGYPWLIHRLTYRRTNHPNLHVRGYKEEGTTTTPFDMVVLNDMDRFHLVADVIDRVPGLGARAAYATQTIRDKLIDHKQYIAKHGEDMPEIRDWRWGADGKQARRSRSDTAADL
jgi:hypothetical protein